MTTERIGRRSTPAADEALPTLTARPGPVSAVTPEVLAFDGEHARVLLGPHLHIDLEIMFYADGTGVDRLGRSTFDVGPGDVLLVTPGIVHDATGLREVRGWAVEFGIDMASRHRLGPDGAARLWWSNPLLAPFVAAGQRPTYARLSVPVEQRPRWVHRLSELEREQREQADGWPDALAALLELLLLDVARLAAPSAAGLHSQGERLLARVFEVIDDRYAEPLSTGDVAAAVGLTPGYVTTLVRRRTGRTVLEWILERRMAVARQLLLTTDLSAEAIAARTGFRDARYFNRRFRAHHDTAPGRWRSAARSSGRPPRGGG
jgi:AraC-like DNA-binding protein